MEFFEEANFSVFSLVAVFFGAVSMIRGAHTALSPYGELMGTAL